MVLYRNNFICDGVFIYRFAIVNMHENAKNRLKQPNTKILRRMKLWREGA